MQKRNLCLALCFMLFVSFIPGISLLANGGGKSTKVTLGSTDVYNDGSEGTAVDSGYWTTDAEGKLTVCEENDSWNVHYDKNESILYLKNAVVKGDISQGQDGINADGDLTIVIEGANEISGWSGIHIEGNLEIKENGSGASITYWGEASNLDTAYASGLYVTKDLTVHGGDIHGKIRDNGILADYSRGVSVSGHLTILGGSLSGFGGNAQLFSDGIKVDFGIIVTAGELLGYGGNSNQYNSGIYSAADITVTGGEIVGTAGPADYSSVGVVAEHTIFVTDNGKITGYGGVSTGVPGQSAGIQACDYNISGGEVHGYGGEASYTAGIVSSRSVNTTAGIFNGVGGNANGDFGKSDGIWVDEDVNANGGTVIGTGGKADGKFGESYGIRASDNIHVAAGTVTGTSGEASYKQDIDSDSGGVRTFGDGKIIGDILAEDNIAVRQSYINICTVASLGLSIVCLVLIIKKKKADPK